MEQISIFITAGSPGGRVQIGPFYQRPPGDALARWLEALHAARGNSPLLEGATIYTGPYEADAEALNPADAPVTAADTAQLFDEWEAGLIYGSDVLDLYTVLTCALGPAEADKAWREAEKMTGGTWPRTAAAAPPDEPDTFAGHERDRIAARINDELDATAGERDPDGTAGHVAYDTVMNELYSRAEDRPGGPGRVAMSALLDLFGLIHILDALAETEKRPPFAGNIAEVAARITATRALLAEMLCFGSAHIESALARAGLVTVSPSDLERAGVPADVVAKLRARMGAHL